MFPRSLFSKYHRRRRCVAYAPMSIQSKRSIFSDDKVSPPGVVFLSSILSFRCCCLQRGFRTGCYWNQDVVLPLPDEKKWRGGTAAVFHGGAMATQTNKIVNASFFF